MVVRIHTVKGTLYNALADAKKSETRLSKINDLIDLVVNGKSFPYKYILITALAAKASDGSLNPLSLQAQSQLEGAYNARRICHGAILEFEMLELGETLGSVDEPYLCTAARFTELDKSNSERFAHDIDILEALCDKLPLLENAEDAYNGLVYMIQKLLRLKEEKEKNIYK
ncbi:MAG: restriction endonuclease, SacI family [Christensenellaceae bacterium]|jgi:hypothetical protein|nr:restriction endonuclease, SacI family [Christensenellaceae bacterium]